MTTETSRRATWRAYVVPILALLIAAAMAAYAGSCSLRWLGATFPGFLLMPNAAIPTVSTFDWPQDRSALFHSVVVAVDGMPVSDSAAVYTRVAAQPVGTSFRYTFSKDGAFFERTIASRQFNRRDYLQIYGLILFVGGSYLVLGLIVAFLQPGGYQARVFLLQALVAGLYPITAVFLHLPNFPWLSRVNLVLECFFAATWIHLALVFPIERRPSQRARLLHVLPYGLGLALAVLVLSNVFDHPPRLWPLHITYLYHASSIAFFLAALAYRYRENRESLTRLRIKAVLPGLIAASVLPFFAFVNNAISGGSFPVQFSLLLIPLLQGSVAYAISIHDLFDIDRVVRWSFEYALLSLVVVGVYSFALEVAARLMPGFADQHREAVSLLFVFALAVGLNPLRAIVQEAIDRAFYRTRLDYRATVSEVSALMVTLLDRHEIIAQVTRVLSDAMHLDSTHVYLIDNDHYTQWSRQADGSLVEGEAPEFIRQCLAATPISDTPIERGIFPLLLPLRFRGTSIGALGLGAKRSGQPFDSDDLALLRTLADQTAIALQNARSYEALDELAQTLDAKVREQTAALRTSNRDLSRAYDELKSAQAQLVQAEKMASIGQLVAGVAHELNNPASFIHGGLANLTDYLTRIEAALTAYEDIVAGAPDGVGVLESVRTRTRLPYVRRELPLLVEICTEGSERIRKIVDDLRLFARAERGQRAPTVLGDSIDASLRLLGNRLSSLGPVVERDYGVAESLSLDGAQLAHVWTNLVTNALDAIAGVAAPRLLIRTFWKDDAPASHCVVVSIQDNGCGIAPEFREKVFEPFFTTKPIGAGTGLGLSIAYGAVKNHGGWIDIESTVGSGTTVLVYLPTAESALPS